MKRIPVKWIRDKAKSAYIKDDHCYICNTTSNLELHHVNSITQLFHSWCEKNKFDIQTDEEILLIRDKFITEHHKELYIDVFTLCKTHHSLLHSVFGVAPELSSAAAQSRWIEIQKTRPPLNFSNFIIK